MLLKITTINSDDGLSNEQVHAIDQDSHGRLWLAHPTGISCYNGSRIKLYDQTNGLSCIGLRTVRLSSDGTVWIGTDKGMEAMNTDGTKKSWKKSPDWNYGIAESFFISGHTVWAGTSFGLLKLIDNTATGELQLIKKENLGLVRCIIPKDENTLLLASAKYGLVEYNESGWRVFNSTDLHTGDAVICMALTHNNLLLVGTTEGLFLLTPKGKLIQLFTLPENNNKVSALLVDGDEWWIGIGHSLLLASYNEEGMQVKEQLSVKSSINEIFKDQAGNVWLATNNLGLKKITCLRKALQQINCGTDAAAFSIKRISGTEQFRVGGDGFIYSFSPAENPGEKPTNEIFHSLPGVVWDTRTDPADKSLTWIATDDGLYFSSDNKPPEKFFDKENLITSPNRVLLTRGDEIWLGTIAGLYKIKNGAVQEVKTMDGNSFGYVYCLSLDNEKRLWVGTLGRGLWIETRSGLAPVINQLLTEFGNTFSIVTNSAGDTLVIQEDRVMMADKNLNFRLILKETPVAGWSAVWIDEKTIAIGSNSGIILADAETGKIVQRINPHLGKSAWQFTSTRAIYFDGKENLYCAINSGLFVANIKKIEKYLPPPKLYFEQAEWQNVTPEINGNKYKLKPGKWLVTVMVYTNWLIDEEQIRFRFKMVGFDETWGELTETPFIRYNSLPSGEYDLLCQVYTPLTGFGSAETLMGIKVKESFWKFGLAPVTFISSINERLFKSRMRNKILRERNVELEAEINERMKVETALLKSREDLRLLTFRQEKIREDERLKLSREVHDELGQMLTGIKMGIAWMRKKITPAEKNVVEKFDETLHLVDETTKTVRRISTELRPGILDSFGIAAALEWQAAEFEKRYEIKTVFFTNCPELNLAPDKSIVLFRIFQETLTNALRYADASLINVSLELENEALILQIRDNGKGFLESEVETKKTLGILGMKERALMMGGEFKITSTPGAGTTTVVRIPLQELLNKNNL